jgi:hypothetical protein
VPAASSSVVPPPPQRTSGTSSPGRFARALRVLTRHPVLCLALLTPGIVEYLSTSSSLLLLVESPLVFVVLLLVNVGQYTAGALLIREAMLRWGKGWATVGFLGLAYGITEEGLGDNTLFRSTQHADGVLGWYGHFAGVNWVWSVGVLALHMTVSIAFPILLLRLALPETRGRSLIGRSGVAVAFLALAGSTAFESASVWRLFGFWMGTPLFLGSLAAIGALVWAGYRAPPSLWQPAHERPSTGPTAAFAVGFLFFPVALLVEYGSAAVDLPPALAIGVELVLLGGLVEWIRRRVGHRDNEFLLVNLAFGFVLWQGVFGVLLTLGLPYTLPLVALVLVFFARLRRRYERPTAELPSPPPGALGEPSRIP